MPCAFFIKKQLKYAELSSAGPTEYSLTKMPSPAWNNQTCFVSIHLFAEPCYQHRDVNMERHHAETPRNVWEFKVQLVWLSATWMNENFDRRLWVLYCWLQDGSQTHKEPDWFISKQSVCINTAGFSFSQQEFLCSVSSQIRVNPHRCLFQSHFKVTITVLCTVCGYIYLCTV